MSEPFSFLSAGDKEIIKNEFGSVVNLYLELLKIYINEFQNRSSPPKLSEIRGAILNFEERLDGLNLEGHRIMQEVSNDLMDKVVARLLGDLLK